MKPLLQLTPLAEKNQTSIQLILGKPPKGGRKVENAIQEILGLNNSDFEEYLRLILGFASNLESTKSERDEYLSFLLLYDAVSRKIDYTILTSMLNIPNTWTEEVSRNMKFIRFTSKDCEERAYSFLELQKANRKANNTFPDASEYTNGEDNTDMFSVAELDHLWSLEFTGDKPTI